MSTKRHSLAPAAPKPPTSLSSNTYIADQASFVGTFPITIGGPTLVHPRAKLNSTYGPITIGANCILSERCQIGLPADTTGDGDEGVEIQDGVVIEVGAVVEAKIVGERCVIEVNAKIGKGAVLGKV